MKRWHLGGRVGLGLIVTLVATIAHADPDDLDFQVQPLFEGPTLPQTVQPLLVTLGNQGPGARGVVTIRKDGFVMRYPVDLPQGTTKQFIAYTASSEYSMTPTQYLLETDQGSLRIQRQPSYDPTGMLALTVSDVAGVASAFRVENGYRNSVTDAYGKPGRLPDRVAGYSGCASILLGEGAERMSDAEVGAIQDYVLLGGSVVMFGGASTPLFADPRWRDWVPIEPGRPKTIVAKGPGPLGLVPSGSFTLTPGSLRPGAITMHRYANENLVVKRTVGKGRVIFIAVNMLESPARSWEGTDSFVAGLNVTGEGQLLSSMGQHWDDPYTYPSAAPYSTSSLSADPFQAKLPDTGVIIGILVIYFILVVPINLLALRRMGRGELAWITSPIISLVFAGVFFRFAAGLYAAEMSAAVNGTWVVDELAPRGQFVGKAQLFFPRGGTYDLQFEGVGHIAESGGYDYRRGGRLYNDLRAVDDGQIRVPSLAARNLSFHEFSFQQVMPGGKMFSISTKARTLTYSGDIALREVRVVTSDGAIKVGDLTSGATIQLKQLAPSPADDAVMKRLAPGQFAVIGHATNFRPGPKIGQTVDAYELTKLEAYGTLEGKL